MPLCIERRPQWRPCPGRTFGSAAPLSAPPSETRVRRLPLVRAALEEFFRRPRPELRDVLVGLDRHVDEDRPESRMCYLLDLGDVDVLDRVVVGVHLERAARRLDRCGAHRLEEFLLILDV